MKKIFSILIILGILLITVAGCGDRDETTLKENLIIMNNSNQKIYSFGLEKMNSLGGGAYADGSPVKKGESFGFQMDKQIGCEFTLIAKNKDGNEILRSDKFKVNFTEGKITIYIKEDENGKLYAEVMK